MGSKIASGFIALVVVWGLLDVLTHPAGSSAAFTGLNGLFKTAAQSATGQTVTS
jgi:hypothetical protein